MQSPKILYKFEYKLNKRLRMKYHAPPEFKQEEIVYILENHKSMGVPDMAKYLKRGPASIYAWMQAKNLTPFRNKPKPKADHPFRKSNKKLEVMLSAFKDENVKRGNAAN